MTGATLIARLRAANAGAAAGYCAAVILCLVVAFASLASLGESYAAYSAAAGRLAAIEGRAGAEAAGDDLPASPFLDGPTVTVAGAELQRRVASAVAAVGGAVLSSQIDLQGSQAAQGYVVVSTSCEIAQSALQPLLYDLEAGLPYLFVEQLVAQAPPAGDDAAGKPMRVQIDVAGQWQVAR